jgi:2-polyprenyl-3-methyl-5-hydroxy-6-metoxy-1,4-benzoquinol methylase
MTYSPALERTDNRDHMDPAHDNSPLPPQERYQFKPFPGSSHSWALSHLEGVGSQHHVLDIGAGGGAFGRVLQERGVVDIDAIEVDHAALEHIRPFYRSAATSLREVPDATYDIALLLDVLEHLTNAEEFFAEALAKVKVGGRLLVSVPNIAHWSIRLSLLCGYFRYTSRGILDRTHVRFFTVTTLQQFLRSFPQVNIREVTGSISPAEFVLPGTVTRSRAFAAFSAARQKGVELLPGLCAFQVLAVVEKTG